MKTTRRLVALFLTVFVYFNVSVFGQTSTPAQNPGQNPIQNISPENLEKLQSIIGYIIQSKDSHLISKLDDFFMVYSEILSHFVDEKQADELMSLAMKGMVNGLDPYSNLFVDKKESQEMLSYFSESSYSGGIGISINRYGKEVYVTEVFDGTPAYKGGIVPGDLITKIDGNNVYGMNNAQVSTLIKGQEGTSVSLEIKSRKSQKPKTVSITRQKINISSVTYKNLENNIGYIKVRAFNKLEETGFEFFEALHALQNKEKLIVDVRNNGGGSVATVIDMVGDFIGPELPVIIKKGRVDEVPFSTKDTGLNPVNYPKKIVVLVNNFSASASEIMAGNLQYYQIAKIIGVRTFGKATVQDYLDLDKSDHYPDENTRLLMGITIAHYLLPDGRDITKTGIVPDIEVEQAENFRFYDYGTKKDAQLQEAIKFLKK